MIVKTYYINNDFTRFIPRSVFTPKLDEKIWLTTNNGIKPPTICKRLISIGDKLALDGQYVVLELDDKIEIKRHDTLKIQNYELYVNEVE